MLGRPRSERSRRTKPSSRNWRETSVPLQPGTRPSASGSCVRQGRHARLCNTKHTGMALVISRVCRVQARSFYLSLQRHVSCLLACI